MANLLTKVVQRSAFQQISLSDWASFFDFGGLSYPYLLHQTYSGSNLEEPVGNSFEAFIQAAYKSNGVVFACMLARLMLFSEARFQFQRMNKGRPGDLYGNADLAILEKPWPGGTTGDMLARAIQDADLSGNGFLARRRVKKIEIIKRMRPDWVTIVMGSDDPSPDPMTIGWELDATVIGYMYHPGGYASSVDPVILLREEVAHFAPIPDPLASYRGMSWITPLVREVMADSAATQHKLKFFSNGATPNLVVSLDPALKTESFKDWMKMFADKHEGVANAYRTLYLGGGATAQVIGANLRQMDFKVTQGAGEPLALDTPVPTPSGWTTMGEIEEGDVVFGRDGLPARVKGVSPVHVGRPCYEVTFSDRTSIVADGGHLWRVIDRYGNHQWEDGRPEINLTTEEIRAGIAERAGTPGNRYGVPPSPPVELPERDLLVDPYVLGAWLGDGATAGAAICGAEPDLREIAGEIERRGYVTRWYPSRTLGRVPVIGLPGGLLAALDALGVLGNKHIPDEYLRASHFQRLDLLRGLMDSDGAATQTQKAGKGSTCEFSSKWEHLAAQVAELARSLGYRVTISRKEESRSRTGESWRVFFHANESVNPFFLSRKAQRVVGSSSVKNRAIISVKPVASVPVRCIMVDSPDHLFLAGVGWELTHNTRIAAASGVPPIIVGLSEGLAAATYSNYSQARRRFADLTMRPLWRNFAGSLETIVPAPPGSRLWYDDRDIPALIEDKKDLAEVQQAAAASIGRLIDSGFEADSVVRAVSANDMTLLKHTGLFSVQLQAPGSTKMPVGEAPGELPAGGDPNGPSPVVIDPKAVIPVAPPGGMGIDPNKKAAPSVK